MAGLPEVIGLLYRADWTRLSLSAELRSETDREPIPLPRPSRERWYRAWPGQGQDNGRYVRRGALLIGPGGRWRLECPVPGQGAEGEAAEGNDGERGWSWRPPEMGDPPPLPAGLGAAYPPPPELFCPSCLLGGYTLEELGPVTVAGRDAIAVAATPRRDALSSGPGYGFPDRISHDRIEVAVDAELGILLRWTETSGGDVLTRTELTDLTMNPPEAADPARFAPPPGSRFGEDLKETMRQKFSGPGWDAADVAAGGLGALIKHVPHRRGHGAAEEQPEAMPSPDPPPLGPADGSPPSTLGFDDEPAEQGHGHGSHDGPAVAAQDQRPRRRALSDEGRPDRDYDRAERSPGEMLRSRAAGGFGRYGDADAAPARNGQQDAGRHPGASQTNGSHELTAAHQEQGPGHDPPIGSGVASQHADRLPDWAVGGRLDRVGDQPAPGGQDRRQAGRDHCPPRNRVARTRRPRRWARRPAHMPPGGSCHWKLREPARLTRPHPGHVREPAG